MIGLMDRCLGTSHFQLSKLSKSFKNSTDNQDNNLYVGACRRRCLYLLYRLSILGPIISISYLVSEFCPVDDIVFVCFLEFLNFDINATLICTMFKEKCPPLALLKASTSFTFCQNTVMVINRQVFST